MKYFEFEYHSSIQAPCVCPTSRSPFRLTSDLVRATHAQPNPLNPAALAFVPFGWGSISLSSSSLPCLRQLRPLLTFDFWSVFMIPRRKIPAQGVLQPPEEISPLHNPSENTLGLQCRQFLYRPPGGEIADGARSCRRGVQSTANEPTSRALVISVSNVYPCSRRDEKALRSMRPPEGAVGTAPQRCVKTKSPRSLTPSAFSSSVSSEYCSSRSSRLV
jgi:hypothetical protein